MLTSFLAILSFLVSTRQFWDNFDTTLTKLWQNFDKTLTQLWPKFDITLTQIWDNFGTTLRQFWQSYGTTLGPHSNYLETILAKLWDHIVTIGGAYPCPVGGMWPCLNKLDDNCDANRIVVHVVRSPGVSQTWCLVVEQTSVETSVVSVTIPGFWAVFCIHHNFNSL